MSEGGPGASLRTTVGAPRAALEELLQEVRRALAAQDEDPSGAWVEESAAELASGAKPGWFFADGERSGLAFFAQRGASAYGHLHTNAGPDAGLRLATALVAGLPPEVASLDLGFSGLAPADEREVVARLATTPGSTVIPRQEMDRPLSAADGRFPADPPAGLERVPVSAVTLEALAELDRSAFAGTVDAKLVGSEPEANRRAIDAMLRGRLGRFLEEGSTALLAPEPIQLVGVALSVERTSHRALLGALMVDPARRRGGLGRYLVGWSLRALWALGYESVHLWVTLGNEAALGLYREFGFRPGRSATIYRWDRPGSAAHPHSER